MRTCKSCIKVNHSQEIELALEKLREAKNIKVAKQEQYEERLKICDLCEHVDINGVCMMCGCYVKIRAFVQANKCPLGGNKKW